MIYTGPRHLELEDHVVIVNRVTKVIEGGRRLRLAALVVVGGRNGRVGSGTGKTQEVPKAIRKAIEDAKKNLIEILMAGSTVPHGVIGAFSGGRTLVKPAVEGSGVAAGGPARAVLELAGVVDITSRSLDSNTPINVVRVTIEGLEQLKRAEEVAELRDKSAGELIGQGEQQ